MFYLIGIGLKPEHLTLEALHAIEECGEIYLETYTSAFAEGDLKGLKKAIGGKKINLLERAQVEEEFAQSIMPNAKKENIALLVFGAPLFATTHIQLLIDAKALKVKTQVVQGISVQNFLPETGLDAYKFGRVATIVAPEENYAPESFYEIIENNFANGLHTLCLLDIKSDFGALLTVAEALQILSEIEERKSKNILRRALLVGIAGMGSKRQKIAIGNAMELADFQKAPLPQSLIICGKLNEKENEAIGALYG